MFGGHTTGYLGRNSIPTYEGGTPSMDYGDNLDMNIIAREKFEKFFGLDDMKWSEPDEYGTRRMIIDKGSNMQSLASPVEKALQQAGQQSTVSVVNQSNTQNISTASSSSNQNNVGQTQQSIPISNTHGAAPRSV